MPRHGNSVREGPGRGSLLRMPREVATALKLDPADGAANWKRGGTFVHCTLCFRRARTLRWFRRHWVRAHC